jgi:hypothetical protein
MPKRFALITVVGLLAAAAAPASSQGARLSVQEVSSPPANAAPGERFKVKGVVANSGDRARKGNVRLSLRSSRNADPVAQLGSVKVRIPAEGRKRFAAGVTVPDAAGSFLVVACVKNPGKKGKPKPSKEACRASKGRVTIAAPPSKFTPGARSLGDPLFPQIGNGGYDALHYEIELDYDREDNVFDSAVTTMTATATQDLSRFSLDFQDLPVDSVTVNGAAAAFVQDGPDEPLGDPADHTQPMKLSVTPAAGIPAGSGFTVRVAYHGAPQVFVDTDNSYEGWIPDCIDTANPCDSAFVVGEPIGAQAWFPSNNHPSDKATFDTTLTVADGEQAFGVGELVEPPVDNPDPTTTWSWSEDDPLPTYLVTASNGVFSYSETTATDPTAGAIPVYNALDQSATATQEGHFATLVGRNSDLLAYGTNVFGPYPFDSYGAIYDNAPGVGYALEVATKSHFASLPNGSGVAGGTASTYLHELAHQWFGNSATLERWNDIWFNEGWAQWAEWDWQFAAGGTTETPADQFQANYDDPGSDWTMAPAVLDGDPANLFTTFPTYTRGAMTIEGYHQIVGDANFFGFAQAIQEDFAYDNVSTEEFIELAKQYSGFSDPADLARLDAYFQEWLFGTTKPTITPATF